MLNSLSMVNPSGRVKKVLFLVSKLRLLVTYLVATSPVSTSVIWTKSATVMPTTAATPKLPSVTAATVDTVMVGTSFEPWMLKTAKLEVLKALSVIATWKLSVTVTPAFRACVALKVLFRA